MEKYLTGNNMTHNAAIVCLTRGYNDISQYSTLIKRNNKLYENFNNRYNYPLIIFHEGNITGQHQEHIFRNSNNQEISFVDIKEEFTWPSEVNQIRDNRFNLGYRMMCRFHSFYIWEHLKNYDYVLRVDEDGFIEKLDYDVFQYMQDNSYDYLTCRFMEEYHLLTNSTLPQAVESLIPDKFKLQDYDQTNFWIPYTNLYIAKTSFFLDNNVNKFLKDLISMNDFLMNRWGDAPVHGITLKAFEGKISHIKDCVYRHGSHDCLVKDGRAMDGFLSEREGKFFNLQPIENSDVIEFDGQRLVKYEPKEAHSS